MDNTIEYYNKNAEIYCEKTLSGDFEETYTKFLKYVPKNAYILDFGCGSGRDSKYFIDKGYKVKAIDGSSKMCEFASKYLNQTVDCMKFEELDDINVYDAIWANASILHVKSDELPNILSKMFKAVKNNGIIYASFQFGDGIEIREERYFNHMTKDKMEDILSKINCNFCLVEYFETISSTKREHKATWVNFIIKKCINKI